MRTVPEPFLVLPPGAEPQERADPGRIRLILAVLTIVMVAFSRFWAPHRGRFQRDHESSGYGPKQPLAAARKAVERDTPLAWRGAEIASPERWRVRGAASQDCNWCLRSPRIEVRFSTP